MKKFFSLILALVLAAGLATSAFAATNFVSSPEAGTLNFTVTVQNVEAYEVEIDHDTVCVLVTEKDGCKDKLVITPYNRRNTIEETDSRSDINEAYSEILSARDGNLINMTNVDGSFVQKLTGAASAAGTTTDKLAVSHLFDVTYYHTYKNETEHDGNDIDNGHQLTYTIGVDNETIANYVALLHRKSETSIWSVVPNMTVNRSAGSLSFVVEDVHEDLSPYAIVVKTGSSGHGGNVTAPKTADPASFVALGAALMTSAGGLVVLGKRKHD